MWLSMSYQLSAFCQWNGWNAQIAIYQGLSFLLYVRQSSVSNHTGGSKCQFSSNQHSLKLMCYEYRALCFAWWFRYFIFLHFCFNIPSLCTYNLDVLATGALVYKHNPSFNGSLSFIPLSPFSSKDQYFLRSREEFPLAPSLTLFLNDYICLSYSYHMGLLSWKVAIIKK